MDRINNDPSAFSEREFWRQLPGAWHPLCGRVQANGWSLEWHDFSTPTPLEWSRSFHPRTLEVCLNLAGEASLSTQKVTHLLKPDSSAIYFRGSTPITAWRQPNQRHQFLCVELDSHFVRENLPGGIRDARPFLSQILNQPPSHSIHQEPQPLTPRLRLLVSALKSPPVSGPARTLWFTAKLYELAAELFFDHSAESDLFCTRQTLLAHQRVERAAEFIRSRLAEPPSLEEIGAKVGCSPFYLSRTFSQQMGMTIPRFIRQVRLERAAELLRSGRYNVTEAALEVGYSSIAHFSSAFHEAFGCCPGLFPIQTPSQSRGHE